MTQFQFNDWFQATLEIITELSAKEDLNKKDKERLKVARRAILSVSADSHKAGLTLPTDYSAYVAECFSVYFGADEQSKESLNKAFYLDGLKTK